MAQKLIPGELEGYPAHSRGGADPARTGARKMPTLVLDTKRCPAKHFSSSFLSSFCFGDRKPIHISNILNFSEA